MKVHKVRKKNKYSYNVEGYDDIVRYKPYELIKVPDTTSDLRDIFREKGIKRRRRK